MFRDTFSHFDGAQECNRQTDRQTDEIAIAYTTLPHLDAMHLVAKLHCGLKKTRQLWRTITTTQFSRF